MGDATFNGFKSMSVNVFCLFVPLKYFLARGVRKTNDLSVWSTGDCNEFLINNQRFFRIVAISSELVFHVN